MSVHLFMRTDRLDRDGGTRLIGRIRALLGRIGVRLAAFTLNGEKLVDEASSLETNSPDSERELDTYY